MSWRTVIISNQSKLDYKMGYLVVRGIKTRRIHIDEILNLVIENPAVSMTGCLIEVLVEKKIKVIFCDSKRNPTAELVPHHGSHDSLGEKIIDLMELITEFDREKFYVIINLRSYLSDEETERFMDTVIRHRFSVLMIESNEHLLLPRESRFLVDKDLCEISWHCFVVPFCIALGGYRPLFSNSVLRFESSIIP